MPRNNYTLLLVSTTFISLAVAFHMPKRTYSHIGSSLRAQDNNIDAEQLLAKAKAIRESIPDTATEAETQPATKFFDMDKISEFAILPELIRPGCSFRIKVGVGREDGTWMDPRWGASGRRIEFTLDVSFPLPTDNGAEAKDILAAEDISKGLLKSVTTKSSSVSKVYKLNHAPCARLKRGFDKMEVLNGGYCIETTASSRSSSTLRFCLSVAGKTEESYGDVSIPEGNLYFALPYFGTKRDKSDIESMVLSTKEGIVTVKQIGWHTGWRREESRILGTFRAVALIL
jgi:hypothetical protein